MSQGGYQQYGGNPYGSSEGGYGGQTSNPYGGQTSNPYGGTSGGYGASNPYGATNEPPLNPPAALHQEESMGSQYSMPAPPPTHQGGAPLSQQDFLARVEGAKGRINGLSTNISSIATIHQRLVGNPDNSASAQLEGLVTQTQVRNTEIKDEIKFLERDAARDSQSKFKKTQVETLKRTFKSQLEDFQREEADYRKRYREAIARQYRIVNPDATEAEVTEAANADWGDEGIFQQALKSNRSGQANSVLGAVRARHNDIQRIEKTIGELALLFQQLDEAVVAQDEPTRVIEDHGNRVKDDTTNANTQLDEGIKSARRARRLKWWTLLVVVLIIVVLGLALGLYFGLRERNNNNNNSGQ